MERFLAGGTPAPVPITCIDYLAVVRDRHATALAAQRVNYAAVSDDALARAGLFAQPLDG